MIVIVDNDNITYVGDESCIKNSMIVSSLKQSSLMRNAVIFESYSCENEKCWFFDEKSHRFTARM